MLLINKCKKYKKIHEIKVTIKYLKQKYDYCRLMMYTGISVNNLSMATRWFKKAEVLKKALKIAKRDLKQLK